MVIIAGFGNPLLDMTVKTNDENLLLLLQKYNLNADDQIEFDECKMRSLMNDIKDFHIEHTPGGSVQNTLRLFQWLYGSTKSTYMIGSIGNDKNGTMLKKLVESAGVQTIYIISNKLHTGISVDLIHGENRSLVASIGAAELIDLQSFNKVSNDTKLLEDISLIYMEGFFIPKREKFAKHILQYSKDTNKLFAFNLSAPYICKENKEIKYFAQNCNILFGNVREYCSLLEIMQFSGDILEFAKELNKININTNWKFKKIIVITNGSKTVTCIYNDGQVCKIDVPEINPNDIKDTTGAGDSFVAGFLFGLFKNCTPENCMRYGCWTAQQVIKEIGCKVPNYSSKLEEKNCFIPCN